MTSLQTRLDAGEIILLDGGTGTEIQRQGAPMNDVAWCGVANKNHGEFVRKAHIAYIEAGADVITANTFATARHVLEGAGYGEDVALLNRRAVELAFEARDEAADHDVAIAGSLSCMPPFSEIGEGTPRDANARDNYREQASILAEAGVELLITEMMLDPINAAMVTEAARETGLPVWNGMSAQVSPGGGIIGWQVEDMVDGDGPACLFEDVVKATVSGGGQVAGVMHTRVPVLAPALEIVKRHWSGPLLAYAETGRFESPNWIWEGSETPESYVEFVMGWIGMGVQVVGGCCGTTPDHIRRLREVIPAKLPNR